MVKTKKSFRATQKPEKLNVERMLSDIRSMLNEVNDKRATALAELKEEEGNDPFRILIGTILSHRTRDENTTKATANLFSVYPTVFDLARADVDKVKELIRPAGFYNVKAKNIIDVARQIVADYGGEVPNKLEELLKLRSVGRKTANCVLVYGYGVPAIPVDTHVHRISNRLGIVTTSTPEETEEQLMKTVPKKYWLELNDLLVRFGQTICKPVAPKCEVCKLRDICKYYKETSSKRV